MWKQSENIVHRLFSRQISRAPPNTHIHRARGFYENVVPSHTVYEVDCPDQWWRRFTNDGQYLVCFSRSSQDLLIYRPLWLSYHSKTSEYVDELPAGSNKFESYFSLLHRIPLATGLNEGICKDFFLSTENNLYGIFATSTAPDQHNVTPAPTTRGAVAGVPCIEKITFLVVRLADGVITARSVFQDDYIHLAHNQGVFLHDDLLAILSVRFQRIHILQIRDGGLFLDIRTIGEFCREDDELLLNSLSQEEARFQQEQAAQRKGRGLISEPGSAAPVKFFGSKPWKSGNINGNGRRTWLRNPSDDSGTSIQASEIPSGGNQPGVEILDVLYDGYFRGFFSSSVDADGSIRLQPENHPVNTQDNVHVWRFVEPEPDPSSIPGRHFRLGREYSRYEDFTGGHQQPSVAGVELGPRRTTRDYTYGFQGLGGRREHVAYESAGGRRRFNGNISGIGNGTSSSGDNVVMEMGHAHGHLSSIEEHGVSTRPASTLITSRSSLRGADVLSQDEANPQGGPFNLSARSSGANGDLGATTSAGVTAPSFAHASGSGSGVDINDSNAGTDTRPEDDQQQCSQILGGLKHRLLSFILRCIQNDDLTPAAKVTQLKRFYFNFQQFVNLVMWKVQFLDRCHLLIRFGSVDGLVARNSEASNQTSFLAVYNMETTDMRGFYQNNSEELLQCVERYCDHFRMAPQYPLYMNFISSYSNNSFAREQLQKQKSASMTSKVSTYPQVVRRTLASLPHNSQSLSPSPYFDQYLFHYDEKLISATERQKPCMEHPIKFISRRRPNILKFKINPGTEFGSNDSHIKRVASFFFHPIFPFAISVQQSFMQTTIVNFHFRK